jgi:16S rRNA (adenine1518-N6/adenine1519-N6)-dimethyltransferase
LETKKALGQHFLKDTSYIHQIVNAVQTMPPHDLMLEVGPGMGALTTHLIPLNHPNYMVIELDDRFVELLPKKFPILKGRIIHKDFLRLDFNDFNEEIPICVVGNFPYNISTQIVFSIIENRDKINGSVGMFQKEVAMRIASKHGSKDYGILSVLAQVYFDVEYLFDVPAIAFDPPPKVVSGVISMRLKENITVDYKRLKTVVKAAFNQRRKTLRNSLKVLTFTNPAIEKFHNLRPEQCSVADFVEMMGYMA